MERQDSLRGFTLYQPVQTYNTKTESDIMTKITMKEIKEFFKEQGIQIKTEKTNYSGRTYRLSNDNFPLTRAELERKYFDLKQ